MIVEDKRGNENATNRFEKTVKCEARFESNLLRASGGVPTGRRRSLIIIVLSTFCNCNVKYVKKFNFHYAVRYVSQQVFCRVTVSPTKTTRKLGGDMLAKVAKPNKNITKKNPTTNAIVLGSNDTLGKGRACWVRRRLTVNVG